MNPGNLEVVVDLADPDRKKRFTNRSKAGCLRCRQRHVRCDERRPACFSCVKRKDVCKYPVRGKEDEERRLLGLEVLWKVEQPLSKTAVDPFNSMPIKMPYKSRALLHHFVQVHGLLDGLTPPGLEGSTLLSACDDPVFLHCALLTAASHSSLSAGGLLQYEQTYRFHMAESLRILNAWLDDFDYSKESLIRSVKLVTALCILEARVGNAEAAKAHLSGLLALRDAVDSARPENDMRQISGEVHHLDSCIVIADVFMSGLWDAPPENKDGLPNQIDKRFQALALAPYFINKTSHALGPREVDITQILPVGRTNTNRIMAERCSTDPLPDDLSRGRALAQHIAGSDVMASVSDVASNGLTWLGNVQSGDDAGTPESSSLTVVPLYFAIAAGQYFAHVLGFWALRAGNAQETRIQQRKLRILQRGVRLSEPDMVAGKLNSEVWLWQAFCGLLGADNFMIESGKGLHELHTRQRELHSWFAERVRVWARMKGATRWEDARAAMHSVIWQEDPLSCLHDNYFRGLWNRVVNDPENHESYPMKTRSSPYTWQRDESGLIPAFGLYAT
ncbi:hypothetical protein GQ53DRAFT_818562 [Thozetella sp. PMI_491]|nr:hypothetical protein GQ53DRAFT_818562 [Thozetella sp. PMI_491]